MSKHGMSTTKGERGDELHLTTGHFLGDYMGLAASGPSTAYPLFGVATQPNITVEYTGKILGVGGLAAWRGIGRA